MQGTVLQFDHETHKGFISGHDGKRYHFTKVDWRGDKDPKEGQKVDFEPEDKNAKDVIALGAGQKSGNMAAPAFVFIVGLMMSIGAVLHFEEGVPDDDLAAGLGIWLIPVFIASLYVFFKQKKGVGWTVTGLVLAVLSFLMTFGNTL